MPTTPMTAAPIHSQIETLPKIEAAVDVLLTSELVHLLSEQLYQSPYKAIEELLVNAWDADANHCKIYVPTDSGPRLVAIFDDGSGMDHAGLQNLWRIGRGTKERGERESNRLQRKQIGRFGIGKLSAYALGRHLTYITKSGGKIRALTIDFDQFKSSADPAAPTKIKVYDLEISHEHSIPVIDTISQHLHVTPTDLAKKSWTIVLIEQLKERAQKIRPATLKWVISTALPKSPDFRAVLNGEPIKSEKSTIASVVEFNISQLPIERLNRIASQHQIEWEIQNSALICKDFPNGITGEVSVTEKSIIYGKSEDLQRSHGFFIRVRNRLINERDPEFGLSPLPPQVLTRFSASIYADDLDQDIAASREDFVDSDRRRILHSLLREVFNEARKRFDDFLAAKETKEKQKNESERHFVGERHVERPVADVLAGIAGGTRGAEADGTWFYLHIDPDADLTKLIHELYENPRRKYLYDYDSLGTTGRVVMFNPFERRFTINQDHDFAKEYMHKPASRALLEDFVTAEALLEVYLRERRVHPQVVGTLLEQRDALLKALAKDHPVSPKAIADEIRNSAADEHDLELALVAAARCLGFSAKHIAGSGTPDGIASYTDPSGTELKITLEAKSTISAAPGLGAFDFSGLVEHQKKSGACGTLLLAPGYPGGEGGAVAFRSGDGKISCWRVEDLARLVESAEQFHISAAKVLEIVTSCFTPDQVSTAVSSLLSPQSEDRHLLYKSVLATLIKRPSRTTPESFTANFVWGRLTDDPQWEALTQDEVCTTLREMAVHSKGLLQLKSDGPMMQIIVLGHVEELERRLSDAGSMPLSPRRPSQFRER